MKRRAFITLLGGAAVTWPLAARAQQPAMPVIGLLGGVSAGLWALLAPAGAGAQLNASPLRLGYVWLGESGSVSDALAGLLKGLQDLDYVDGKNLKLDKYYANGSEQQLNALLAEIVQKGKTDVLVSVGTIVTRAVKKATTTIPVVSFTGDPISAGVVTSIAHPGGNITGFTVSAGPEIGEKWVELLHEAFPKISRVAVLWDSANPYSIALVARVEEAAARLNLTLFSHGLREPSDFAAAFDAIRSEKAEALVTDTDPLTAAHTTEIAGFAINSKLPGVFGRDMIEAGGLMSYEASIFDVHRNGASYVDKIAKGANPGDLPIQQPIKFELVVNLKTAKALGLDVPASVLARADEVIE